MIRLLSGQHDVILDATLKPTFQIENGVYVFFPLNIASIERKLLGSVVVNLTSEGDNIFASLELLLARY